MLFLKRIKRVLFRGEVLCALLCGKIMGLFLPVKKATWLIGKPQKDTFIQELTEKETIRYFQLAYHIHHAVQQIPWKAVCLDKGYGAVLLLRRRKIPFVFHFGVSTSHGFEAHAWVSVGNVIVTGGEEVHRFKELTRFYHR